MCLIDSFGVLKAQESDKIGFGLAHQAIQMEVFDQKAGLPLVSMADLTLGKDGYMYISSYGGVARFNGEQFDIISTQEYPSLLSNRVIHLLASADSSVWFIDEDSRFSRWKNGQIETFNSLFTIQPKWPWEINLSPDGTVWICDHEFLKTYDSSTNSFNNVAKIDIGRVIELFPITDSTAYLIAKNGVYFVNGKSVDRLDDLSKTALFPASTDNEESYLAVFRPEVDRFIIADDSLLIEFSHPNNSIRQLVFPSHVISSPRSVLCIDSNNLLIHVQSGLIEADMVEGTTQLIKSPQKEEGWFSTYDPNWEGKRLYISKKSVEYDGRIIFQARTEEAIEQSVHDLEGNLWLAVGGRGLVRLKPSPFYTIDQNQGLHSNNTYSIIQDQRKKMWLASYETGIHRVDSKGIDYWSREGGHFSRIYPRSLFQRSNGNILAGFWDDQIFEFDGNSWIPFKSGNQPSPTRTEAFFEDSEGVLFVASRDGVFKQEMPNTVFSECLSDGKPISRGQVFYADQSERVWLGTHNNGLFLLENGNFTKVKISNIEPKIRDIWSSHPDTLWLATENIGLVRASVGPNNSITDFKSISLNEGLPDVGVHRILFDDFGYFWLSSNQGISRIQKSHLDEYLSKNESTLFVETFTESHGLPIRETNGGTQSCGIMTEQGTIWIPTQKGVVVFDPHRFLQRNPYKNTKIKIRKIVSDSRQYSLFGVKKQKLALGERSFTIAFDKVHFSQPELLQLEYRLSKTQTRWAPIGSGNELSISNLPPGIHKLDVRLKGIPNSLHQQVSFELILPHYFYEQQWFRVATILILVGMISIGFFSYASIAKKRELVLNRKVAQRTQSLHNQTRKTEQALIKVQEQAEELEKLNRMKTDFFINMTHELRTPLTLIKGPLSLLQDSSGRTHISDDRLLALIRKNSDQLSEIVDQLLQLLRVESQEEMEELKRVDIVQFTKLHTSQFTSSEHLLGKSFIIQLPDEPLHIIINPRLLKLILNNLISNAIKYTNNDDEIFIHLKKNENEVNLEIRDTGIGIPNEQLTCIFDPFTRATNSGSINGSGIGLSIVKNFVERAGGTIEADSVEGKSSTFSVTFPIASETENNQYPAFKLESITFNSEISPISTSHFEVNLDAPNLNGEVRKTILLVEDNRDLQQFIRLLIEPYYNVQTANNGKEALALLGEITPSLIISDLMMPQMGGIEFIQKLRETDELKTVPVIILSAKQGTKHIYEGLSAGAQVFLPKPIDNDIFLAQIEALIEREERLLSEIPGGDQKDEIPELIAQVDTFLLRHLSESDFSVIDIAESLNMTVRTFYRKWKEVSDDSITSYIMKKRLAEATLLIESKDYTFAQVAFLCGFSSPNYFSRTFKKNYGVTPSDYFLKEDEQ